jgi:multicomponent Na+:H+ antiporter subunit D
MRSGLYPPELRSTNLDFDVLYRKFLPFAWSAGVRSIVRLNRHVSTFLRQTFERSIAQIYRHHGPTGNLARPMTAGSMVFWVVTMLSAYLILSLIG